MTARTRIGTGRVIALIGALGVICADQDAPTQIKTKTNIAVSGCLMRQGYATFVLANANVDATGDDAANAVPRTEKSAGSNTPARWILDSAGVAGPHVGEKVQVIGFSDWVQAAKNRPDDQPSATPHIEVQAMKVIAKNCS